MHISTNVGILSENMNGQVFPSCSSMPGLNSIKRQDECHCTVLKKMFTIQPMIALGDSGLILISISSCHNNAM